MKAACSDEEFIRLFTAFGASETSRRLHVAVRNVHERRRNLEKKYDRPLWSPRTAPTEKYPERQKFTVKDGLVLVGSDAHYWPGIITTAHKAFVKFCADLQPVAVVLNGDVIDGAAISRHPPSGTWKDVPNVGDELDTSRARLTEIEQAAGKKAKLFFTLGNHDARFASRLQAVAPEYARVHGMRLEDHFPSWAYCWSVWINNDVVVQHRFRGGSSATATAHNVLWSLGKTMVTGHLHSLRVTPVTGYGDTPDSTPRTRYGVDTGSLADSWGPQFDYALDIPHDWRSGFCLLTFKDGELLWPELIYVREPGVCEFRGDIIEV